MIYILQVKQKKTYDLTVFQDFYIVEEEFNIEELSLMLKSIDAFKNDKNKDIAERVEKVLQKKIKIMSESEFLSEEIH